MIQKWFTSLFRDTGVSSMKTFSPNHLKLNTNRFLKLSLTTVALSMVLGSYTRANAEPAAKVEVISIPSQEAYYIEKKAPQTSSGHNSSSVDEKIVGTHTPTVRVSGSWQKTHNTVDSRNLSPAKSQN